MLLAEVVSIQHQLAGMIGDPSGPGMLPNLPARVLDDDQNGQYDC